MKAQRLFLCPFHLSSGLQVLNIILLVANLGLNLFCQHPFERPVVENLRLGFLLLLLIYISAAVRTDYAPLSALDLV
jgi:hypothetical protein